jgi:Fe2+ transport system protein FeoA
LKRSLNKSYDTFVSRPLTLDRVALGVPVRVVGFPGMSDLDETRLAALGLRAGVPLVKILRTPLRDPIECLVGSQLLAVEARLLPKISVESAAEAS